MREVRAVWVLLAGVAVAVLVTYARLPADELYHVSGTGLRGGLSRLLVEINFPDAFVALAVLAVIAQQLSRRLRLVAAVAAGLCLFVPFVVDPGDLDARWINVVPAVGVALVVALSLWLRGLESPGRLPGDRARLAVGAAFAFLAAPWIAAAAGVYLDGVPLLGRLFQTSTLVSFHNEPHHAVHHGIHHGLLGLELIVAALVLSRLLAQLRGPWRTVAGLYFAFMVAYGIGNIVNDDFLEQITERGWVDWAPPSVLEPAANWLWLVVLLATPVIWYACFRPPKADAVWTETGAGPVTV